jgi:hypothetical protein
MDANSFYSMLKSAYRLLVRPKALSYGIPIENAERGNASLAAALTSGEPLCAGRLGSVELNSLERYLRKKPKVSRYSQKLKNDMTNNAGFFPADDESMDLFGKVYAEAIKTVDFIGVWFNRYEDYAIRKLCPDARLIALSSLEPYYFTRPWSRVLGGKRVLVVHPFAESIRRSYAESRSRLFRDPSVLPQFQLTTMKAVQSHAGAQCGFSSWFEALDSMKERMTGITFDVCIVGAGAYGLPLASYAKSMGKQAIHMGGASQVLFGIIGKRWEEHPVVGRLINEFWRRPSPDETPPNAHLVENGCYW